MKPLRDLIDQCGDAEPLLKDNYFIENETLGIADRCRSAYRQGHRACFEKLAPALREAVKKLEKFAEMKDDSGGDGITGESAAKSVKKIRALLEAK